MRHSVWATTVRSMDPAPPEREDRSPSGDTMTVILLLKSQNRDNVEWWSKGRETLYKTTGSWKPREEALKRGGPLSPVQTRRGGAKEGETGKQPLNRGQEGWSCSHERSAWKGREEGRDGGITARLSQGQRGRLCTWAKGKSWKRLRMLQKRTGRGEDGARVSVYQGGPASAAAGGPLALQCDNSC